jgi:hypothetical protein
MRHQAIQVSNGWPQRLTAAARDCQGRHRGQQQGRRRRRAQHPPRCLLAKVLRRRCALHPGRPRPTALLLEALRVERGGAGGDTPPHVSERVAFSPGVPAPLTPSVHTWGAVRLLVVPAIACIVE